MNSEQAYVINLDHRTDRWENAQKEFGQILDLQRVSAVNCKSGKLGWVGCMLSHIKVLKMAKANNLPYVIVIEDDCIVTSDRFAENLAVILKYLHQHLEQWDYLNLCPLTPSKLSQFIQLENSTLIEYGYALWANFVIYNSSMYDVLTNMEDFYLELVKNQDETTVNLYKEHALDIVMNKLQIRKYTCSPIELNQLSNYSDLEERVTNYQHLINNSNTTLSNYLKSVNRG